MISSIFITVLLTISSVIRYEKNEEIKVLTPEQHPNVLLYDYNECSYSSTYDGEDKSWFALEKNGVEYHFHILIMLFQQSNITLMRLAQLTPL